MRELLRLGRLLAPHKGRIALGLALALATLLANIGLLAISSWFIASMALAGSIKLVIDYTLPAAAIRGLAIVRSAGRYAERLVNHDTTFRILSTLRLWFYRSIVPLAPARLAQYRSGDLLARIRADIDSLDDYYVRGLVPAAVALLASACILPYLARFDARLALVDALGLGLAGLLVPILLALAAARHGRERVLASSLLRASIVEEVEGLSELIVLGAVGPHAELMEGLSTRLDSSQRRLSSLGGMGDAALVASSSLAVWASSLILVGLVASGSLPPADLAALSVFVLASFEAILPLPAAIQKAGEMAAAARRLFEIIDAQPEVAEPRAEMEEARGGMARARAEAAGHGAGTAEPRAETADLRAGMAEPRAETADLRAGMAEPRAETADLRPSAIPSRPSLPRAAGLSIRGLRFRYRPELPPIFDGLDLELGAGEILGLAGPSGSGKSSLFSLLMRFWDYQGGSIELDLGQNPGELHPELRSLEGAAARLLFSALPQAPFLYNATIRDNLLLALRPAGGPPESGDDGRLMDALEAAQLGALVARLPDGLDTTAGERGTALSVGEVQRLALARAFLKEAPIYLLDEPTEGLDEATAEDLLDSTARRLAGRSLLIISHRERDFRIAHRVQRLAPDIRK